MADKYRSFEQLRGAEREDVDFRILCRARGSDTVIVAPHGGAIEPGTSEIAHAVAGEELSFYAFEGLKPSHNVDLHITSSRFDEPRCIALLESSVRVVAIHGEASDSVIVYLGGRDTVTGVCIEKLLKAHKFAVLIHPNSQLQGQNTSNICNRGQSGAGVQIEISCGARRLFFASLDAAGRKKPTQRFNEFVVALREALA
jgi:phage replication-related protein YjqB (UPF0714/DUF867 family)